MTVVFRLFMMNMCTDQWWLWNCPACSSGNVWATQWIAWSDRTDLQTSGHLTEQPGPAACISSAQQPARSLSNDLTPAAASGINSLPRIRLDYAKLVAGPRFAWGFCTHQTDADNQSLLQRFLTNFTLFGVSFYRQRQYHDHDNFVDTLQVTLKPDRGFTARPICWRRFGPAPALRWPVIW